MNTDTILTQLRASIGRDFEQAGAADALSCGALGLVGANGDVLLTGESLRPVAVTLAAAATTMLRTSSVMIVTGDGGGNTIATITGGSAGSRLTLLFIDTNVTITDTAAATVDTVNLSASFTSSANDTMSLIHNGTKWLETARSVN